MTSTPTEPEELGTWGKLRRRKVVQWGIAYAAAAWGFLQGLQYVSDAFGWPGRLRQVAILGLLTGLPVMLVIAWYHGDRGEQRAGNRVRITVQLIDARTDGHVWAESYDRELTAANIFAI